MTAVDNGRYNCMPVKDQSNITVVYLDPVHTEPDEYLFKYETGRIKAPLTGGIRDQKLGIAFHGIGLKF